MPRLKSLSAMPDAERNKTLDDFLARFVKVERLILSGAAVAKKPSAPAPKKATAAPKKKTAAKAKTVAAPKKKAQAKTAAPKVKAKATAKKTTAAKTQTSKKPPRLIDAIQTVIGSATMNAQQVYAELKKRHWLPNSDDPLGYIRYTLSKEKDIFLRIEGQRGHYHLGGKGGKAAPKAKPAATTKAAPAAPKSAPAVAPPAPESTKTVAAAPEPPKAVAAPPPPPPPAPAPAASKPAGEDEDPSVVADAILAGVGVNLGASPGQ